MTNNEEQLNNSEYWSKIYMMVSGCEIIDPDGWDRKNYEYSWYQEKISWEEFQKRAISSTQWTLPLEKRYKIIFNFLSENSNQLINELIAEIGEDEPEQAYIGISTTSGDGCITIEDAVIRNQLRATLREKLEAMKEKI